MTNKKANNEKAKGEMTLPNWWKTKLSGKTGSLSSNISSEHKNGEAKRDLLK